jgi:hypothetical protein
MSDREDGFWLVRADFDSTHEPLPGWGIAWVVRGEVVEILIACPWHLRDATSVHTWGPRLASEAGEVFNGKAGDHPPPLIVVTIEGARPATPEEEAEHERQRAEQRAMLEQVEMGHEHVFGLDRTPRTECIEPAAHVPDFEPSTDYEGEDTRAIDGAMMRDVQLRQRCESVHPTAGLRCECPRGHDDGHAGWVLGGPVIPWPREEPGGEAVTMPSEDGGRPWTVTIPGIKIVSSEACPPEAVYMSTDREIVVLKLGKTHKT